MFGINHFGAFVIAGILLNITPGADTMFILGRSVAQGKKAGILSALGISTGALVHCLFAALGLSIILAKSAVAFETIKYLGAAYLVFLGIKSLITSSKVSFNTERMEQQINYRKLYVSGIITDVLNPKVALFFLAFLPQFIEPEYANSPLPFLLLGVTFLTTGTIWCLIVAIFASKLSERIRRNPKIKVWLDRITGGVFVGLGIKLALTER